MKPIGEIAKAAGIDEKYLECYGRYKAKVDLSILSDCKDARKAKLVLVTAMTPTPAGEGKTTTTIGLADGLSKIGKKPVVALREPSLGPVSVSYTHLQKTSVRYFRALRRPARLSKKYLKRRIT